MNCNKEGVAVAHASRGGHVCGYELQMRAWALAVIRSRPEAVEVYVMPKWTIIETETERIRYRNCPKLIAAIDAGVFGGAELGEYTLMVPTEAERAE